MEMEDLNQVEVEITFDPDTSSVIQVESPDQHQQPSTSKGARVNDRRFRMLTQTEPLRISNQEQVVYQLPLEISDGDESEIVDLTEHENDSEDDGDWEETLIYVDLDDIPNVQELFAYDPDDFLLSQSKRHREEQPKIKKPTRSEINLKFYNLDDDNPILQIGDRFYTGKYEEPFGTNILFREKPDNPTDDPVGFENHNTHIRQDPLQDGHEQIPKTVLRSLVPDPEPPLHPVFGNHKYCTTDYELVAKVHKVLKMTRRNVIRQEKPEEDVITVVKEPVEVLQVPNTSMIRTTTTTSINVSLIVDSNQETPDTSTTIISDPPTSSQKEPKEFVPLRTVDLTLGSKKSNLTASQIAQRTKALRGVEPGDGNSDSVEENASE